MWRDEIDDPEFQDPVKADEKDFKIPDFFHQPITSLNKNILNAITGEEYPFKIGSYDEYRFFVVMESDPNDYKEARRLYFDTPEQYERITRRVVSDASKRRFYTNQRTFGKTYE
jgi:hypothetical protein